MNIEKTTTYGGFFYLPGADLYTIRLAVRRSGSQQPVVGGLLVRSPTLARSTASSP
jgi:hypothetical protein